MEFAERWSVYAGSERAEAQTFLNELFACYGKRRGEVAQFEEPQHGRFLDLIWPRVCLIEMKRPSEADRLERHRAQAFDYWRGASDTHTNTPSPRFVVICAFRRLEIWEPGAYPNEPRAVLELVELPERPDALAFLAGDEPVFLGGQEAVTRGAARSLTRLFDQLQQRRAAFPDVLRDFILQVVWCMFAEDLGQIEHQAFTRLVDGLIAEPRRSSSDDLGGLFDRLNTPGPPAQHGLYAGARFANGGLFERPAHVHLDPDELARLRETCSFNWAEVEPHIFGSILEGALGPRAQHVLGAHYTHEVDIQKVVGPTIVSPWRERIENADTHGQAMTLQQDLLNFVVLDPACGSGNFLYVAYRELRRLEQRLKEREAELRRGAGLRDQGALNAFFSLNNMRGIELNGFAIALARVTLWMAHKLSVDELDLHETTLPLEDLSGLQVGDALRIPWPRASVIIGNPPFHGDRHLRGLLGDDYVRWLAEQFGCGVKDHCVYWFRRAHDHLEPGQRAGLVGTNSISQNRARSASLDYIVENGGVITDAVSTQDWPGLASVDVSIVDWIREPNESVAGPRLDGQEVAGINTALRASATALATVRPITSNRGRAFQGFLPGAAYDIDRDRAVEILSRTDASYDEVVHPYMDGRDIVRSPDQRPSRFVIDFAQMTLEEAMRFPAALEVVRAQAKEARETSNSYVRNPRWWQFLWPRPDFRRAAAALDRFIVGTATARWVLFVWADTSWRPSNATNMFAFDSNYAMGVLTSSIHTGWAREQSSTLGETVRYTPTSAFETFPWPQACAEVRAQLGEAGHRVLTRRQAICRERRIGLTTLYNQLEEGAWADLSELHRRLDLAVVGAYGWEPEVLDSTAEVNGRLLELNERIRDGAPYSPF